MRILLPLVVLLSAACQPNVLITVEADASATEDGLKNSGKFELSLFLYSQADEGIVNETKTVSVGNQASFSMNPGTLDLYAVSVDSVDPPESCDEGCDGYWEGETVNLVVPPKGHIEETVKIFAVCDCP